MENFKNTKTIKLTCGVQGCCPEIEINEKNVFIVDDYGNKVQMTRDQWNHFVDQYEQKR
jgi:hypothetical protein